MPTPEIWCRFGTDLVSVWKFKFAYAKSVPTSESQYQVSNKLSVVGIDLASVLELTPADTKSMPTPEIWCLIWHRFGIGVGIETSRYQIDANN